MTKRLYAWIFRCLTLMGAWSALIIPDHDVSASTFSTPAAGIKVFAGTGTDADYIETVPANSAGISVNSFSQFIVTGKKLRIFQGGYQAEGYRPAKVIVITSPEISLADHIELVGEPADIVFIDTSSSVSNTVKCTSCGFSNFGRVTLAAAATQYPIGVGMSRFGKLSTFSGGAVSVNSLNASGIQSLEVIAERVSTAGAIDTQIRGEVDSSGAYRASPIGKKIIGNGGINIYTGTTAVVYESLEIAAGGGTVFTGVCEIGGTFKSAMINVIASCPLTLASSATLSTVSDAIATSEHRGQLIGVQEGIYLQTNRQGSNMVLNGNLRSDNLIQAVSLENVSVAKEMRANNVTLLAKNGLSVSVGASINADVVSGGADWFSNQGSIQARSVEVETNQALYNHFGGRMKGDIIKLISNSGTVINGSRTDKAYMPASLPAILLTSQLKGDDRYGVYHFVSGETGPLKAELSAQISANSIHIKAKRFENINPYGLLKPDNVRWDQGIDIDVAKSRRVIVQAEKTLEIEAPEYVLNSSAIIGLNQSGSFDVNTALLMNQRYRVDAQLGVFSRISYSANGGIPTSSKTNVSGIETYLTAYSPPGILYTFGELTFSNGVQNNAIDSEFVNQFSFLEVLADANFHEAALQSIGLVMPIRAGVGHQPIRCAAYGCTSATYKSLIEFETLTSFSGNVYGISSDLLVQTVNQLEDGNKQALIDQFVAQRREEIAYEKTHINPTGVGGDVTDERYVSKVEVLTDGTTGTDYVHITISQCMTIDYYHSGQTKTCTANLEKYSVAGILSAEAGENLINGLPWTGNQIAEKANAYIEGQSRSGSLAVPGESSVSGTYIKRYTGFSITEDNLFIVINYDERFKPTSQSGLTEAQSRSAGYYAVNGTITVKLNDLMGAAPSNLPVPTGLTVIGSAVTNGSAEVNLRWNAVVGQNFTYKLNGKSVGSVTSYVASITGSGTKDLTFRVQACNTIGCSEPSNPIATRVVIPPTSADTQSCTTSFFRPFTNQYKTTLTADNGYGEYGNYCGMKTVDGTVYLVIAGQYQRFHAPEASYTVCSNIKLFDSQALVDALVAGSHNYPVPRTLPEYQGKCSTGLAISLTRMTW